LPSRQRARRKRTCHPNELPMQEGLERSGGDEKENRYIVNLIRKSQAKEKGHSHRKERTLPWNPERTDVERRWGKEKSQTRS